MTFNLNIQNSLKYQLFITDKTIKLQDLFDFKYNNNRYALWDIQKYNLDGTYTLIARKKIRLFTNVIQDTFEREISTDEQYTVKNTIYYIRGLQGTISVNPITCDYRKGPLNKTENCSKQTDERTCNNSYQDTGNNKLRCSFDVVNKICTSDENNIVTEIANNSNIYCSQYLNYQLKINGSDNLISLFVEYLISSNEWKDRIIYAYGSIQDWFIINLTDLSEFSDKVVNIIEMEYGKTPDYAKDKIENFNEDISGWNVSNVTSMKGMFKNFKNFNKSLNNWNVSKVTNMQSMFENCSKFNSALDKWDVSKVTTMQSMFENCEELNIPLYTWRVDSLINTNSMFKNCKKLSNRMFENYGKDKTAIDITSMFENCENFHYHLKYLLNQDTLMYVSYNNFAKNTKIIKQQLPFWLINKINNQEITDYCTNLDDFPQYKQKNKVMNKISLCSNVPKTDICNEYYSTSSNTRCRLNNKQECISTNNPVILGKIYGEYCSKYPIQNGRLRINEFGTNDMNIISDIDVSEIDDMSNVFQYADKSLYNNFNNFYRIKTWDTSNVKNMNTMFNGADIKYDNNFNLSEWNVDKVTNMYRPFANTKLINEINIENNNTNELRKFYEKIPIFKGDNIKYTNKSLSLNNRNTECKFSPLDKCNYYFERRSDNKDYVCEKTSQNKCEISDKLVEYNEIMPYNPYFYTPI